jgi:hypothetical protein
LEVLVTDLVACSKSNPIVRVASKHQPKVIVRVLGQSLSLHSNRHDFADELKAHIPGSFGDLRRVLECNGAIVEMVHDKSRCRLTKVSAEIVPNSFEVGLSSFEKTNARVPHRLSFEIEASLDGRELGTLIEEPKSLCKLADRGDGPPNDLEASEVNSTDVKRINRFRGGGQVFESQILV